MSNSPHVGHSEEKHDNADGRGSSRGRATVSVHSQGAVMTLAVMAWREREGREEGREE